MILLSMAETWLLYIGIVLGVIILLGLILYFTCGFRFKREKNKVEHVVVDEVFVLGLLEGLGGLENIKSVSIDNGRVKFSVSDLDLINGEGLKELSTSGVFITGSNVKLLFKYDSEVILTELVKRGVNKC